MKFVAYIADTDTMEDGVSYMAIGNIEEEAIAKLRAEWEAPGNENLWHEVDGVSFILHVNKVED